MESLEFAMKYNGVILVRHWPTRYHGSQKCDNVESL